jgi:leucine efflux protein
MTTMLGISDYPAFAAAVLVFLMLPGPGTFAILGSTAQAGSRGGYSALAGLMIGDWILMGAAMAGVAAALSAHPVLFQALQWGGVVYLGWTGLRLLLAHEQGNDDVPPKAGAYFRHGLLITLMSPKAIVFYMAFFPLFIDPAHYRGLATLAAMGGSISVLTLAYCSALIFAGEWIARRIRGSVVLWRILSRLAGIALIGFGARLAAE